MPLCYLMLYSLFFFFSSRRRHTRLQGDWSSDVCSSDLGGGLNSRPPPRQLSIAPSDHHRDDSIMSSRSAAAVLSGAGNDASPSRASAKEHQTWTFAMSFT